jgi:large subunit ribosomal protein L4
MKVDLYKIDGSKAGKKVDLPDAIFGTEPNEHVVYLAVKQYRAAQRRGTAKSKERNEVKGSTKKIKRQKGTGTARAGDIKNPLFRHGGTIFGPKPRSYNFKINKKESDLAKRSVLSAKVKDDEIIVVQDFALEDHRTKGFVEILNNLEVDNKKTLILMEEPDRNMLLASRNIPNARIAKARNANIYDLINADKLVITETGLNELISIFDKKRATATA